MKNAVEMTSGMPEDEARMRREILENFGSERLAGLDMDRVGRYLQSRGFEAKPVIVIERKDIPLLRSIGPASTIIDEVVHDTLQDDHRRKACYFWDIDLIFLWRDRGCELVNGSIYTEGFIVHEQAHASNAHRVRSHRVFKNGASGLSQPRIGFALLDAERLSGYLFEEGWADMHRAEYIELNASPQYKQALSEAANWRDMELHETLHITTPQKESVALPLKYCHLTPQGGLTFTVSAYAGYAMELILNKHPHLREMMREARRSVDGLRVFAREIEGIKPGLYRRIRSYYYTEDDFGEALSYVTREISDGIAAIVSDNTNPRLRQYWHTALADKTPKPE